MMLRRAFPILAGVLLASAPAGAEGGGNALVTPQIGLMFWTTLTFVLLAIGLKRFAWKPLVGAIEERERSIRVSLEQAKRERDEAAALLEQHRQLLAVARRERSEATAVGQREAERLKAEILEAAKKQRDLLLNQTDTQVQSMVRQAREELRGVVADLAIQAAGKLLSKNLDDASQRRLVEDYLADLDRRPAGPRAGA